MSDVSDKCFFENKATIKLSLPANLVGRLCFRLTGYLVRAGDAAAEVEIVIRTRCSSSMG